MISMTFRTFFISILLFSFSACENRELRKSKITRELDQTKSYITGSFFQPNVKNHLFSVKISDISRKKPKALEFFFTNTNSLIYFEVNPGTYRIDSVNIIILGKKNISLNGYDFEDNRCKMEPGGVYYVGEWEGSVLSSSDWFLNAISNNFEIKKKEFDEYYNKEPGRAFEFRYFTRINDYTYSNSIYIGTRKNGTYAVQDRDKMNAMRKKSVEESVARDSKNRALEESIKKSTAAIKMPTFPRVK